MSNRIAKYLANNHGIGVRYGCHCAHILVKHILHVSPFLERFQRIIQTLFPKNNFPGVTRISLGIQNNEKEVDALIEAMKDIAARRRSPSMSDVDAQINNYVKDISLKVYG
jgi:selenocysteine lyase/cysteine desulfurase